jgi:hypothetical protein
MKVTELGERALVKLISELTKNATQLPRGLAMFSEKSSNGSSAACGKAEPLIRRKEEVTVFILF